jgi:hypothetical protein
MSELEQLRKRVAALEKAARPKEPFVPKAPHVPFDPTAQLSMPPSAIRDMCEAVPDKIVRDIANDHIGKPVALPSVPSVSSGKPGGSWAPERPLVSNSFWDPNRPPPPKDAS